MATTQFTREFEESMNSLGSNKANFIKSMIRSQHCLELDDELAQVIRGMAYDDEGEGIFSLEVDGRIVFLAVHRGKETVVIYLLQAAEKDCLDKTTKKSILNRAKMWLRLFYCEHDLK
ncbi:MAG: hypothetical protein FWC91_13710 [Defluviitaleaceae bacterium]|nr:hypothetical protein [Defluviitaleaceae bacterium]